MKASFWLKPSLARGIGIHMGMLAVVSILLLTYQFIRREQEYSKQELLKQAEIMLETTALTMRDELYSLKIDELEDLARKISENKGVTFFRVYDRNGKKLVDSETPGLHFSETADELGRELVLLPPDKMRSNWQTSQLVSGQAVMIGNRVVGAIAIGFSTEQMDQRIQELTLQGFGMALAIIFAGAALTFLMARQITMPLSNLATVAAEMEKGNLSVRAKRRKLNDEIGLLSTTFNEMADAIQERERALREQADGLERTVNERTAELQEQARILEEMAITDPLTHAYNRRQFYKLAESEMKRAEEHKRPLSVIVMDADHFKRINDRYGHQAGDQALIKLTEVCQSVIRDTDLFARYGGEEFVVLMPHTDIQEAKRVAERIRQKIEEIKIELGTKKVQFTISLGVSTFTGYQDLTFDSLLTQADRALYASKNMGRNRVTHWVEQTFQYN